MFGLAIFCQKGITNVTIPTLQPPGSILSCILMFHVPIISHLIKSGPATYFLLNILECTESYTAKKLWLQIKNLFPQVIFKNPHFRIEWYVCSSKNRCRITINDISLQSPNILKALIVYEYWCHLESQAASVHLTLNAVSVPVYNLG